MEQKQTIKMSPAKKIYLFKNGDIKTEAKRIVVSEKTFRNFEQVISFIIVNIILLITSAIKLIINWFRSRSCSDAF